MKCFIYNCDDHGLFSLLHIAIENDVIRGADQIFRKRFGTSFVWNLSKVIVFFVADMIEKNALEGIRDYFEFLGKLNWLSETNQGSFLQLRAFLLSLFMISGEFEKRDDRGSVAKESKSTGIKKAQEKQESEKQRDDRTSERNLHGWVKCELSSSQPPILPTVS